MVWIVCFRVFASLYLEIEGLVVLRSVRTAADRVGAVIVSWYIAASCRSSSVLLGFASRCHQQPSRVNVVSSWYTFCCPRTFACVFVIPQQVCPFQSWFLLPWPVSSSTPLLSRLEFISQPSLFDFCSSELGSLLFFRSFDLKSGINKVASCTLSRNPSMDSASRIRFSKSSICFPSATRSRSNTVNIH